MLPSRCSALLRAVPRQVRSYGGGGKLEIPPPHMNELPVPQGSWQELHSIRQKKYNAALVGGITFFIGTCAFAKSTGLLFFNFFPPESID